MGKCPSDIPNYLDLVANLEELGLSKYESMAYITLVSRGTLGASEIAYYSNLPRTKIYTTLRKLEKKKLSTISSQKPTIATATPPNEAFEEIITLQERRLEAMRRISKNLENLREEGKKVYEEKKYLILEPNVVVQKIEDLISSTKSNIDLILDSWGQNVILQSKSSLSEIARKGIKIKMLLGIQSIIDDSLGTFPNGVEIKSDSVSGNILIFDFKKIIFIDSTNGKASQLLTADSFGTSYLKLFDEKWKKALRVNPIMLSNENSKKALTLSRMIDNELSQILLDLSIKKDNDYSFLTDQIEKFSSDLKCKNIEEIISIVDYALRMCYFGYVIFEEQNNNLKIYFNSKEKSVAPWVLIIMAYIKKFGNNPTIAYDQGESKGITVYITFQSPNLIHAN